MYCPKCGLQQIADEMRFCSRCGLPIGEVAEWLARGATLVMPEEAPVRMMSPRRKGIRRGAKVMFLSGVLMPLLFGISLAADHPIPLMIALAIFLLGLSIMLYSRFFGEEIPSEQNRQAQPPRLGSMPVGNALPPASNNWVNSAGRERLRTAELAQPPPSVTEHTTRLLDNE